jgi:hypothetical protein
MKENEGALRMRKSEKTPNPEIHRFKNGRVCETDSRGHKTPGGLSIREIVVDASEGFIPLWDRNMTLRWRFRESSLSFFENPTAAKAEIRALMAEALVGWGDAAPIRFAERADAYDFEIVVRHQENCTINGCVLASAFFPDPGRHLLTLYPTMFEQTREEQVETMAHEIGHVFGLRHFFADVAETQFPSEIFGTHTRFSIMNYDGDSRLTNEDKSDLKRLYQLVWSGELAQINGTPIRLMRPFHTLGTPVDAAVSISAFQPALQPALTRYATGR